MVIVGLPLYSKRKPIVESDEEMMNLQQLESIVLQSWPAFQQQELDGWLLRFAEGYTKRANSVNILKSGTLPLDEKIALCENYYQEKHLPVVFRLTSLVTNSGLDQRLAQMAYQHVDLTSVQVLDLHTLEGRLVTDLEPCKHSVPDWVHIFHQWHKVPHEKQALHQRLIENIASRKVLMTVSHEGKMVAAGMGVAEGAYVGLFDLITSISERRRGFGAQLLKCLLNWGKQVGASHAYLQVTHSNTAAKQLYAKLGFSEVYHYWYRVKPKPEDTLIR